MSEAMAKTKEQDTNLKTVPKQMKQNIPYHPPN